MVHDVFSMPEEYSILITLLVPMLSAVLSMWIINICDRRQNIVLVSFVFSMISTITALILYFIFDFSLLVSLVLVCLNVSFGTAGRFVFGGVIAFKMRQEINSGSYIAAINSVAAVMAGVVPPVTGSIIDSFSGVSGYGISYLIVGVVGIFALALLLAFNWWCQKDKSKRKKTFPSL